ncbi:MAG: molybdopterin-dependent oxidoreductase [Pseudomonadota bacterium]
MQIQRAVAGAMIGAAYFTLAPATGQDALYTLSVEIDGADTATLTMSELDAMRQVDFVTSTIWTDGENQFSGVPLADVLATAGISDGIVQLIALNDYSVEIPVDEIDGDYPIIATRMDHEAMPIRDKGPFWVIYPYDHDPEFQTETIYARSIWQLQRISVLD